MFWHKKPEINYYVCTINKTFAKPGQRMYFQVHYTEENLLDYIDPNNATLMVKLANGRLRAECRTMVGTDKRATITTNWSEFRRRANIHEGEICAFHFQGHFKAPPGSHRASPLDASSKTPQLLCQYNLALTTPNYALSRDKPMVYFWTLLSHAFEHARPMPLLM